MALRSDQMRDKDSIQRDTVSAKIAGPIDTPVIRDDDKNVWILVFLEPNDSQNRGNAKFAFEFETLDEIDRLGARLQAEVIMWRERLK